MDLRTAEGKQQLGKRIHSAIAAAGYDSLSAFADELGCSRALIYQYVNGEVLVQLDRLQTIADLTDRSLEFFFTGDDSQRKLAQQVEEAQEEARSLKTRLAEEQTERVQQAGSHRQALIDTLQRLAQSQREAGDVPGMLETCTRWLELAENADDSAASTRARLQLGHAWYRSGDYERAETRLREVLSAEENSEQKTVFASARQELVRVLQARGDIAGARSQAQIVADEESWWSQWSGRISLAALAEQSGDLETAGKLLDEVSDIVESADQPAPRIAVARTYITANRCNLALTRGRLQEAIECARRLQSLAAEAGAIEQVREAGLNLGIAMMRAGQMAEAAEHLQRIQDWAEVSGDDRLLALVTVFKSEHARHGGDTETSRALALEAVELAGDMARTDVLPWALLNAGYDYLNTEQISDARYHFQRCAKTATELGLHKPQLAAQMHLAALDGDREGLQKALQEAEETGYDDLRASAHTLLADVAIGSDIFAALEAARDLAHQIGDFWGECRARLKLSQALLRSGQLNEATNELVQLVAEKRKHASDDDAEGALRDERRVCAFLADAYAARGQTEKAERIHGMCS
ncbi:MAG: hypothetical protein R6V19_09945 [Armatimonadota bacterium]